MLQGLLNFWREPRPALGDAPLVPWRVVLPAALLLGVLGYWLAGDSRYGLLAFLATVALVIALRWIRVRPLVVAVGAALVSYGYELWLVPDPGFFNGMVALAAAIAVYGVARFGSGRAVLFGALLVIGGEFGRSLQWVLMQRSDDPTATIWPNLAFWLNAFTAALFPLAIGVVVRAQDRLHQERLDGVRLDERHQIARELHDTVAHHVSAIAIQAQAARVLADHRGGVAKIPEVVNVIGVIEEEASRTLDEMRRMVTTLRQADDQLELRPQAGLGEVVALADSDVRPTVDVRLDGDLVGLGPSVEATLFRAAQEAVTNARRHARNATRVQVAVTGHGDHVELSVTDDGDSAHSNSPAGFGLTGLHERAVSLGGTFAAGPVGAQGWRVEVSLPVRVNS